jgi:pyruvate,water dikinase
MISKIDDPYMLLNQYLSLALQYYKRNHGQPAASEMAVVVQEMINPHSAGVIFTADPRTGNPFEMIINANYGLGEVNLNIS